VGSELVSSLELFLEAAFNMPEGIRELVQMRATVQRSIVLLLSAVGVFFVSISIVGAVSTHAPVVRTWDIGSGALVSEIRAAEQNIVGGVRVAAGDFGNDGVDEIVVAAGPGGGSFIRILRQDGSLINEFDAYGPGFDKGMHIATGDLDGDGRDEIIVGTEYGSSPHVRVFDREGSVKFTPGFFAYDPSFRGGVFVAAGDVNGDGRDEIITGAGPGGGPHVRVFDRYGVSLDRDIYPLALDEPHGVHVATANVDGGAEDEIITARSRYGTAYVKVYKANKQRTVIGSFIAFPEAYRGGVNIAGGDVDRDGFDEIIVGTELNGGPQVRVFEAYGEPLEQTFFAYEPEFRGGVRVAYAARRIGGTIVTVPGQVDVEGRRDHFQYVDVNLTDQTLDFFRNGRREIRFDVSSGVAKYPTPEGDFSVLAKIPVMDYEWTYGPEHPDNYDIEDVPYNMRFQPHFYLHGAFWHNNFGYPMSHGCVNLSIADAATLYQLTEVGTPVFVHR